MGFVALKHLLWGDDTIAPGENVPEDEQGRDYASLLRSGHIERVTEAVDMSTEELVAELEKTQAERDELSQRVEELTPDEVVVPDGVTPGETPGWPIVNGEVIALPDQVREYLAAEAEAGRGVGGEGASEEPAQQTEQAEGSDDGTSSDEAEAEASKGAEKAPKAKAKPKSKAKAKAKPAAKKPASRPRSQAKRKRTTKS